MPPNPVGPEGGAPVGPPPGRIESLKQGFWSKLDKARGIVPTGQTQTAQAISTGLAKGNPPEQVLEGLAQPTVETAEPFVQPSSKEVSAPLQEAPPAAREVADPASLLFTRYDQLTKQGKATELSEDFNRLQQLILKQKSNSFLPGEPAELQNLTAKLDVAVSKIENPNPFGEVAVAPDDFKPEQTTPGEQTKANEVSVPTETLTPLAERPDLPKNILADKQFDRDWLRFYREEYKRLETAGNEIPQDMDDQIANAAMAKAAELYYERFAEGELGKTEGISQEIENDPDYQKIVLQAVTEARKKGAPIDPNELTKNALKQYQKQKDSYQQHLPIQAAQTPEAAAPEAQPSTADQALEERINEVQQKIDAMPSGDNPELSALLNALMPGIKDLMEATKASNITSEQKVFNDKLQSLLFIFAQVLLLLLQGGATATKA